MSRTGGLGDVHGGHVGIIIKSLNDIDEYKHLSLRNEENDEYQMKKDKDPTVCSYKWFKMKETNKKKHVPRFISITSCDQHISDHEHRT